MSDNRTKAELFQEIEELRAQVAHEQDRVAELNKQLENPNAERISEYQAEVNSLQSQIDAEKSGANNTKTIANLQSKKSRFNGYIDVLGGQVMHASRTSSQPMKELSAEQLQEKISTLLWERNDIAEYLKEHDETVDHYKRRAVIASDLSKLRKELRTRGVEPRDPVAEAAEIAKEEAAIANGDVVIDEEPQDTFGVSDEQAEADLMPA